MATAHAEEVAGKPQLHGAVSLISLIADPEKYDGKRVSVEGYATVGFENNFLYLSPYDAQVFNVNNALWLELSKDQFKRSRSLDHQPVLVEGTFFFPKEGTYGSSPNGAITKITTFNLHYRAGGGEPPK